MPQLLAGLFIFLSSPVLLSFWWAHALTAIYTCFHIHKLAKYWLFWVLLISIVFFSTEPRFSIEYFLLAAGLYAVSLGKSWKEFKLEKKEFFLIGLFGIIFLLDILNIKFYEKGSLLLLLPFTLSWLFPLDKLDAGNLKANSRKLILYILSATAIVLSNKRATLLSFFASLKNAFSKRILVVVVILLISISFLVKDNIIRHYRKSIKPRVLIYQSVSKGFIDKPIFGHGFGTFALDYPPYRFHSNTIGGKKNEYVNHAHSQVFHVLFENGLLGIIYFSFLLFFIFKQSKLAFYTFIVVALIEMPLKSFGQFLLFGLILNTFNYDFNSKYKSIFLKKFSKPITNKILQVLIVSISIIIFGISSLGHYFFDHEDLDKAIQIDKFHSLYHCERGAFLINQNIVQSEIDLANATKLSPNIGYMQAFYSAALLGNGKRDQAKIYIDEAIDQMGDDAYLHVLASFAHADDKALSKEHMDKALLLNPSIEELLKDPSYTADEFISSKKSNPRVMTFYRHGGKLYLPLPYTAI